MRKTDALRTEMEAAKAPIQAIIERSPHEDVSSAAANHAPPADPRFWETGTGMELELIWGKDETTAELHVSIPLCGVVRQQYHKMKLCAYQLHELRVFLDANVS